MKSCLRHTATTATTEKKVGFADADEINYVPKRPFGDLRGDIRGCENPECRDPDWSTLGQRREEKRTACTKRLAMHCPLSPMKRFLAWVNFVARQKQLKQLEMFNPVGRRALFVQWRQFAARRKEDDDDDEDDDNDDKDDIDSAADTIPIRYSDDESWADDDVAQLSDVE